MCCFHRNKWSSGKMIAWNSDAEAKWWTLSICFSLFSARKTADENYIMAGKKERKEKIDQKNYNEVKEKKKKEEKMNEKRLMS